jgi:thymidylate synthase
MRVTNIEAKTLPEAWFLCIQGLGKRIHTRIYRVDRGSFVGQKRIEYDFVTVRVEFPGSRPLIPDVPLGTPPPTSMDYVEHYYQRYVIGTEREKDENYTYGEDINPQVPRILDMLATDPDTNQACITLGDRNSINLPDPQCLKVLDFRLSYNRLSVAVYVRSWDLWAGFPSNLAAIQLLKESMAVALGVNDGVIIACSKGLHLYDYSWDYANAVLRSGVIKEG